jgi:hypothetical protein
MRRAILALLGVFKKGPSDGDVETSRAEDETERELVEAKRDMKIEAQRRDFRS